MLSLLDQNTPGTYLLWEFLLTAQSVRWPALPRGTETATGRSSAATGPPEAPVTQESAHNSLLYIKAPERRAR